MNKLRPLPSSIEEIAETLGVRLALKIVQVYGGRDIKFPKYPDDDHPIILALGKQDGYAICRYMGGSLFSVPHCRPRRSYREDIKRLEAEGLPRGEIARRLGITQRWVREVANAPPDNQINMFDSE